MARLKEIKIEASGLFSLALPVVVTQLASMALSTIDVLMVGQVGPADLAAVALGGALGNPIIYTLMGVVLAVTPIVAHLYGGSRTRELGEQLRQGLWASLLVSVPGVLLFHGIAPVMGWMNIDPELFPRTQGYLASLSFGFPFAMAFYVLRFFNDGIGLTRPALYVSIFAIPVNILANYLLIYGHLGLPRLGSVGAGWGTSIVWFMEFLTLLGWMAWRPEYRRFDLWHFSLPSRKALAEIFAIGLPSGVNIFLEISMFAMVTLMIGTLGVTAVSSHQVAINVVGVSFMVPLGISIALSSRVGQAMGRNSLADARLAGQVGIGICAGIACLSSLAMVFAREFLVGLYTSDTAIIGLASSLLIFAALFQLSDALQVSTVGALRGLKDTRMPMLFNIIAYWGVGLPLGWLMGLHFKMGARGFWIGLSAGLTASALLNLLRWHYRSRPPLPTIEGEI